MKCHDSSFGLRFTPSRHSDRSPDSIRGGVEESHRRRPELALQAEPRSLHSLRSVGMTEWDFAHVMKCHDSSRWPLLSLCCAGFRNRQTILSNTFFLHTGLSAPSRIAGPGRRKPPPAEKAILFIQCSCACVKRFFAPSPFGFRLGDSSAKGEGPRRRPFFRFVRLSQRNPASRLFRGYWRI